MNDVPSLEDSLERWPGFAKLERRFEPRRTRAAAAQVTRQLGDIEPKPPEPYDLKALYWRVMGTWRRHRSLEGVSPWDLQRLPWVLFYEFREQRRTRRQGLTACLGGKLRVVQDYRRWLSQPHRELSVQALVREFLRVYPTDLRTFDYLREMLQVAVVDNPSPLPSLRKWRQRCLDYHLLEADGDTAFVRKLGTATETLDGILSEAGLDAGLARCEFLKSGIRKYLPGVSVQMSEGRIDVGTLDRVLTLLEFEGKLRYDTRLLRGEVASALLRPFVDRTPNAEAKNRLQSFFIRHFGHPNLRSGRHKWSGVPDDFRQVVLRWLVERDLDQFFLLIKETARRDETASRHWRYREAFWKAIQRQGLIDKTWFLLGPRARKDLWRLKRDHDLMQSTGSLKGAGGDRSVLLMRMPGVTIAEWSHNGKCRFWLDRNRKAPKLYQGSYHCYDLQRGRDHAQRHDGSEDGRWQGKIANWIEENTYARVARDEYGEYIFGVARARAPKAVPPKPEPRKATLAGLMDRMAQREEGATWHELVEAAKKFSMENGLKGKMTEGVVKAHMRFRSRQASFSKKWDVEITDFGAIMKPKR